MFSLCMQLPNFHFLVQNKFSVSLLPVNAIKVVKRWRRFPLIQPFIR